MCLPKGTCDIGELASMRQHAGREIIVQIYILKYIKKSELIVYTENCEIQRFVSKLTKIDEGAALCPSWHEQSDCRARSHKLNVTPLIFVFVVM